MSVGPFCALLHALVAATGALDPASAPTLAALAQFGAEFMPVEQQPQKEAADGWSEVATRAGKRHKVGCSCELPMLLCAVCCVDSWLSSTGNMLAPVLGWLPLASWQ